MSHLGHPNTVKLSDPPEFTTIEKVIGLYRSMNSGDYKGVVLFGRKIPEPRTGGIGGTRFPNVTNDSKKESTVMKVLNGGLRSITGSTAKDKSDYNLTTSGGGGIRG